MAELKFLKKELGKKAGPMAKVIVKKEAKSMGLNGGVISKNKMGELIERCVKKSVADQNKHQQIINELKDEFV
ncbi:MAG: hypothetical protein ACOC5D_01860 [Thermoplasmatota archaeon]